MSEHGGDIYSHNTDILDFSVNINPLGTPDKVIKAVTEGVKNLEIYPDILCRELVSAISLREGIPPQYIVCGNGAAELIYNIAAALMPKKTLVTAPTFSEYERAAISFGSEVFYYEKKEENGFNVKEDILSYINSDLDLIVLCDPDNPVGNCTEKDLLLKIAEKCEKENVFLLIDNCFADFAEDYEKISSVSLTKVYKNILILKSFTKMYAIPALRLGYAICKNAEFIKKITYKRQPWNVSVLAQAAGTEALECDGFEEKTRKYIKQERIFLENELKRLGIIFFPSQTNYILFKCKKGLYDALLKENILIRKCDNFKCLGESFYRIAVKMHKENIFLIKAIENVLRL